MPTSPGELARKESPNPYDSVILPNTEYMFRLLLINLPVVHLTIRTFYFKVNKI